MTDISGDPSPSIPTKYETCRIKEECKIVKITTYYRGKTNSYVVDRTLLRTILDASGQMVTPDWAEDWTEVAPGIATRRENRGTRSRIGDRSHETHIAGSLRIHRRACPVYVEFDEIHEYVDYDGEHSSSDSREYWVRYEA